MQNTPPKQENNIISMAHKTENQPFLPQFCCKEQNKETTQSEMSITWGKMKDLKKIRKGPDSAYQKIVKWKKYIYANPKRKS